MHKWFGLLLCLFICSFDYTFIHLCICLFVCLFICSCLFVCLSVFLFIRFSICLFLHLFVCLSVYICLSICLSVCLLFICLFFVCLFVHLFVCIFFNLSVCSFVFSGHGDIAKCAGCVWATRLESLATRGAGRSDGDRDRAQHDLRQERHARRPQLRQQRHLHRPHAQLAAQRLRQVRSSRPTYPSTTMLWAREPAAAILFLYARESKTWEGCVKSHINRFHRLFGSFSNWSLIEIVVFVECGRARNSEETSVASPVWRWCLSKVCLQFCNCHGSVSHVCNLTGRSVEPWLVLRIYVGFFVFLRASLFHAIHLLPIATEFLVRPDDRIVERNCKQWPQDLVFSSGRVGKIRLLSLKVGLAALSRSHLEEKYTCRWSLDDTLYSKPIVAAGSLWGAQSVRPLSFALTQGSAQSMSCTASYSRAFWCSHKPFASPLNYSPSLSTLLYSTLLYSTLLYSTLLYSTLLYSTLLYSTLLYSTLLYSTLLYSTLLYSTLLYSTLLYSTLLYGLRVTVCDWREICLLIQTFSVSLLGRTARWITSSLACCCTTLYRSESLDT